MSGLQARMRDRATNPLDVLEQIVSANEWAFERRSDGEMAAEAPGKWCDYGLFFSWSPEISAMHFSCAFDMKVPPENRNRLFELLALANEKLWIGHFGLESEDGVPVFRHAVLLRGAPSASAESLEDMVDIALTECERFFPAFQFVLWGGKAPADALQAAMLDCQGEA
ncbi:type III secretion system chaperone family protein [Paracraurococcus ruber]|uniref:YbjN domain-containing protein n=1 Tax=Paracraurococcus ruber TaxID=77675 RepID=A0ABS1D984_9PROT|nr:YbjN domain-containing protein [Paracraurococcus ruber]MBK1662627.1 hypothetical protein [Paracraurococcus ruber]TDG20286.1 hypothetical protein E2C05_27190 [Paracraurococcus ruber]